MGNAAVLIPSAFDSLAQVFGEIVYVRRKGDNVECPCCGKWNPLIHFWIECTCTRYNVIFFSELAERWAGVPVKLLLSLSTTSIFYLPRDWNEFGEWIGYEVLRHKYESFLEESRNV